MELDNRMDKFTVCVKINEKIVGHLKEGTSGKFANAFFYGPPPPPTPPRSDAYSSALSKVTGKKCNLSDREGMQVPCKLNLSGQPKFVSLYVKN